MNKKKLLLHEKVEVRQFEEGLRGSWYSGVVVAVSDLCRSVEYDELLSETNEAKLIEHIPVTRAIEGLTSSCHVPSNYRGRIRPLPLASKPVTCLPSLTFGVCVDAFYEDAWWEGVIFDSNDFSSKRSVFFPDECDECKIKVSNLRVTRQWDEHLGGWTNQGTWILVELVRKLDVKAPLAILIKIFWHYLRGNLQFAEKISEWSCGLRSSWIKNFIDVVSEISTKGGEQNTFPVLLVKNGGGKSKKACGSDSKTLLQNILLQIGNCKCLNVEKSLQDKKENESLKDPRQQKQSVKIKLASNKLEYARIQIDEATGYGEGLQTRAKTSVPKSNVLRIDECGQFVTSSPSQDDEQTNCVSPSKEKKQLLRIKIKLQKPKPHEFSKGQGNHLQLKYPTRKRTSRTSQSNHRRHHGCSSFDIYRSDKNDTSQVGLPEKKMQLMKKMPIKGHEVDSRGAKKLLHIISRAQVGLDVNKVDQNNRNQDLRLPSHGLRHNSKKASRVSDNLKKNLLRGKIGNQKLKLVKPKRRLPSREGETVVDVPQTQDTIFVTHRHRSMTFRRSGFKVRLKDMVSPPRKRKKKKIGHGFLQNDTICTVCHYGGDLILCDYCTSSYHLGCMGIKDVPESKWFCPSCRCGLCGFRDSDNDDQKFSSVCHQCSHQYHLECLTGAGLLNPGLNPPDKFCSQKCFELCTHLHQLLGKSHPTSEEGITWTLMRSWRNDCDSFDSIRINNRSELSSALSAMHECFEPVIEPLTGRDLVADVMYNSISKFKRLDFRGFYVMALQKSDEIISVATVRIHGLRLAEMPLIATCFKYRRQGMCRVLMNELEKMLFRLGVERLVLPAIPQHRETWESSFGFSEMLPNDRLNYLGYPLLGFQGTKLFQKVLKSEEAKGATHQSQVNEPRISMITLTFMMQEPKDGHYQEGKRCILQYKRRSKKELEKENMVEPCNGCPETYKYVYKRRRILANRDCSNKH
ncbi:Agenet-like domain [Dillenia turbinata]|uniref:Agenet-like domain n=1 Tax=Dillenia turbinata TaxID=194707 RepID=A0AAN8UXU7_9MAGN